MNETSMNATSQAPLRPGGRIDEIPASDVSIIRGGPFYRVQRITRLIGADSWNFGRRLTLALAVGWLPLVLATAIFNPAAVRDLLGDYRVAARMVIAVPVLLVGQLLMESRFRMIVHHLRAINVLGPPQREQLDSIIANVLRWRDSLWPELILIALVYSNVSFALSSRVHEARAWALAGEGLPELLPAGWYYALVSQLIYQFLVALNLWKWLLWSYFNLRLSKLEMDLIPTHPDQHGGLGFLGLSAMAFAPIAFALTVAIGSNWRNQIVLHRAHLTDFRMHAIVLLVIVVLAAIGPLAFFIPRLAKLRRCGLLEYGTLGQIHSAGFSRKWILDPNRNDDEFLTAPEISALADYGSAYGNVEKMQPFPIDKGSFVTLALAVAIPLLPVVLTEIPISEILKALLAAAK